MKSIIPFVLGCFLTALIFFLIPEGKVDTTFEDKSKEYDSLIREQNYFIDSILYENTMLENERRKKDTVEKKIYIRLNNDINKVRSINDSDSLVQLIKRTIRD